MVNIILIEKSEKLPLGQIRVDVDESAEWILDNDQFPLRLTVSENDKVVWETNLYSNSFATWDPLNRDCVMIITTSDGILINEYIPESDICQKIFDMWSIKNKKSMGLVIGTHDGTSGEWVKSVVSGDLNAVLVEGSDDQYKKLRKNYPNHRCIRKIVSPNGGDVEMYEFGTGEGNTIDPNYLTQYNITDYRTVKEESISINNLIISEGLGNTLKWLHIDLEGIDDEIIMALDFNRIRKPELIVFEVINFSPGRINSTYRIDKLTSWLNDNGYKVRYDYWNSIAYLTN